jgi:hypothetical protein
VHVKRDRRKQVCSSGNRQRHFWSVPLALVLVFERNEGVQVKQRILALLSRGLFGVPAALGTVVVSRQEYRNLDV